MMIADRLVKDYAAMPADQPLRTIVFLALDGKELDEAQEDVNKAKTE